MKMIVLATIASLFTMPSFSADPAQVDPVEKEKRKIVSRLYQVTYGSSERCKSAAPEYAKEFEDELNRFLTENEKLMRLVTQSPYYERARLGFSNATVDPKKDTTESLSNECRFLASILRGISTEKNERYSVRGLTATLEK